MSIIRDHKLNDHIVVVDKYVNNEDVPLYFCSADVVVLPYVAATQSGIIQIAFALNRPVITTNVGGLPEVVEDGKTGFVVEANSSAQLSEAILKYYQGHYEHTFCEEIQKRSHVFSWDTEVKNIELFLAHQGNFPGN
jgi:glycosyltransferase involved in cell wall biosynthesis